MALFDKFCFFLPLRSGTVIIGVINTLYGLWETALRLIFVHSCYGNPHPFSKHDLEESAEQAVDVIYTENSLFTMQLVFGIYLIYGSVKEKPSFLFANIILHVAFMVYSSCFVVFAILWILREEEIPNGPQIINELLKIPLLLYFTFIIYSRHEELVLRSPTMMEPINSRQMANSDTADFRFAEVMR